MISIITDKINIICVAKKHIFYRCHFRFLQDMPKQFYLGVPLPTIIKFNYSHILLMLKPEVIWTMEGCYLFTF